MSDSQRNSVGSVDTHKYTSSRSTLTDNYSDNFESEPELVQYHEIKQTPCRKVKKNINQWKRKKTTNPKLTRVTPTYEMEQKIVTAKKLNNNELRNLNTDLLRQIEKQKDEIRILKRMEYRQSKALEKFENSKSRLPMLLESHNKEVIGMKEQVRTMKVRYRKSQESLRGVEDELEKTKNRLNRYKALVDDESLQERSELNKQLNFAHEKIKEMETKIQDLENHIQHLVKNYKYEISVEKSQNKKIKLNIQELEEKYNRLEIQLLEKEKELEVWNIYSNRQKNNTSQKINLSHSNTPRSTPSVKSKINERIPPLTPPPLRMRKYEEKRRQSKKQKELMLKKSRPSSPRAANGMKSNQCSAMDHPDLNPQMQASSQKKENNERTMVSVEADMPQLNHQSSLQEDDLGEMFENIKLEKIDEKVLPEMKLEMEKNVRKEERNSFAEDLRKYKLEEENLKKENKEKLEKEKNEDRHKKDLLLAKLKELDNERPNSKTEDLFRDSPSKTGYNFTKQIENLHQGRPSNNFEFFDSHLKLNSEKPNSVFKSNQKNVESAFQKGSKFSGRKPDNMIEDFFNSTIPSKHSGTIKMPGFSDGDTPTEHKSRTPSRKTKKMESSVYKELFGDNVDDNNDYILGDLNRPIRQDSVWLNNGGFHSGDGLNNNLNDGNKLLPSRQQVSIFETRSTVNTLDNSSDSIEEIIL